MMIARIGSDLPEEVMGLAAAADLEDVRNVRLLIEAWASGKQRFNAHGAALFAAFVDGELGGIGGVIRETRTQCPAMRMHRFFVHPDFRRAGLGRRLAHASMSHALGTASLLTCNARASMAAAPFWEAIGFVTVRNDQFTHIYARP